MKKEIFIAPLIAVFIFCYQTVWSQLRLGSESGLVFNQYNDVRAPNKENDLSTLFSLTDDFEAEQAAFFLRLEVAYTFSNKHTFQLIAAPLRFDYTNLSSSDVNFENTIFTPSSVTSGSYQFNTYRFSYRYALIRRGRTRLELGLTVLLRDAKIELTQGTTTQKNTDLGFVPLISFMLETDINSRISFLFAGDALVGPQGRAEDVFAGFQFAFVPDRFFGKIGYRIIEGGADVDQVYNFSLFHFFNVGIASEF